MYRNMFILHIYIVCATFYIGYAQVDTSTTNSSTVDISEDNSSGSTISVITSSTTPAPNITCEAHNNDCHACVKNNQCYYCVENNQCHRQFAKDIVDGRCNVKNAYVSTCNINFRTLLIIGGVLGGIVLLIILILCCYCCCKKKGIKISKDDLKWARQREERQQIAAERRRERAERTEEIRKKYGLVRDSNPYQKFDA